MFPGDVDLFDLPEVSLWVEQLQSHVNIVASVVGGAVAGHVRYLEAVGEKQNSQKARVTANIKTAAAVVAAVASTLSATNSKTSSSNNRRSRAAEQQQQDKQLEQQNGRAT